jgi:diguanylate cyclase (GGDEF)-like protein
MTLKRQLILTVLFMFFLMFVGTLAINVNNVRHYLLDQLASHAQDAATSLALSMSPHMKDNDLATMNSMVDAIFDHGYYREIVVQTMDGKPLITRDLPVQVARVPKWFIDLLPLDTPRGSSIVMSGWKQAAVVYVQSHPGYAYAQLWRNTTEVLGALLLVAAFTLLSGSLILHIILRSLRAVEKQANGIIAREYPIQDKLPWTTDLRRVVEVMNKMSLQVKQRSLEQIALTETLRAASYMNAVTGVGNRRFLNAQLDHLTRSPEEFGQGALFLLELQGLKSFNDRHGYLEGDKMLTEVADILNEVAGELPGSLVAHLSGGNFALVASHIIAETADAFAEKLIDSLRLRFPDGLDSKEIGHVGVAIFRSGMTSSKFLSEADMALRAAQAKGPAAWHRHEGGILDMREAPGAGYWRNLLKSVIADEAILLQFQPIIATRDGKLLHHEALLRIQNEEGKLLGAELVIPMALTLGFSSHIDRLVVKEVLKRISRDNFKYAVNLSARSLYDNEFMAWLETEISGLGARAPHLMFEFPEYDVVKHIDVVRGFVKRSRESGVQFGVDHCGRGFVSFAYLSTLNIDYLKIDGSYIRGIESVKDNQFLVHSISRIAHELDIAVIAASIETEEERQTLTRLYVDGLMGYLIGGVVDSPSALTDTNSKTSNPRIIE